MLYSNYLKDKSQNAIKIKETEGNPCVIENSKGRNLKDYKIYGNSYQATRGKNLWDEKQEFSFMGNGTQVGTRLNLSTSFKFNTQYTISLYFTASDITFSEEGNLVFLNISYTDGSSQYAGITSYNYTQGIALVTTLSGKSVYKIANIIPHARFSSGTIDIQKIQLEEGAEATSYEQYKNMPSVEFPSEIQSVGDLTTKNLFDINEFSGRSDTSIDGNKITISNVSYVSVRTNITKYLKPNTGYSISVKKRTLESGTTSGVTFRIALNGAGKDTFYLSYGSDAANKVLPADLSGYDMLTIYATKNGVISLEDIQIEESTAITDYEPHNKYKVPIVIHGKNLMELPEFNNVSGVLVNYQDGIYHIVPNDSGTSSVISLKNTLKLKAGETVTISCKINHKGNRVNGLRLYSIDLQYPSITYVGNTGKGSTVVPSTELTKYSYTYTASKDMTLHFQIYVHGFIDEDGDGVAERCPIDFADFQIEYGTVATDYEPHQEPVNTNIYLDEPLRKVGDYADYIDFKNQKVVRNIKEVTFDGTENWYYRDTDNIIYLTINNLTPSAYCYSTHFLSEATRDTINPYFRPVTGILRLYQWSNNIVYSSADEFKAFLENQNIAGTPLIVDYILSTPIEENISLLPLQTFKDTNIISTDTFVQSSNINVKYIRI